MERQAGKLRILILEDVPSDAQLEIAVLSEAGLEFDSLVVDTHTAFEHALEEFAPDIVIADYRLPSYNGREALEYTLSAHPEIPVIMATGALGDESAVELLKLGAKDYVLKENLTRLAPAVKRALLEKQEAREREAMQSELQEREEKFRAIFESSNDALMLQDENGFTDCNQRTLELFGIKEKGEFISYHFSDISPAFQPNGEDSFAVANRQVAVALEKGSSHFEWICKRSNGETFPTDVLLTAFEYCGKRMIQATVRDISEKEEARQTSALLRKFFDNTSEGMTITDKDALITSINPAFARITGYTQEEAKRQNPRILKSGEHDQKFYEEMWHEILVTGRWEGEVYNKRKSGEIYPEWLTITSLLDENGEIEHFVAVFFDLTQLKVTQKRMEEQDKIIIAQSRFAAMGEMISMIAHQWRQPITAIGMGVNNMLIDIELDDMVAESFKSHLTSINDQVQFLSHTIDDFRDFFKPDKEKEDIHIDKVIGSVLKVIGKSLENNNIKVELKIESNPIVSAHESEMMQVLLAIINNAKDAMLEHAVKSAIITIATREAKDKEGLVELSIYDNGGGVPEDIRQKIFEPYFTTKSAKSGTGLGLYIAKSIIEKHHSGTITVENRDGGACFIIRLQTKKES